MDDGALLGVNDWQWQTLAYFDMKLIIGVKIFIGHALGPDVIK